MSGENPGVLRPLKGSLVNTLHFSEVETEAQGWHDVLITVTDDTETRISTPWVLCRELLTKSKTRQIGVPHPPTPSQPQFSLPKRIMCVR